MIVLGKLYLLLHDAAYVGDHTAKVAPSHIGRHHHLALHILAVDGVGTYRRHHIGNLSECHLGALGIDNHTAYVLCRSTTIIAHHEREVKDAATLIDLRHGLSGKQHAHHIGKLGHRDTILRHHLTTRDDLQLRALHLLLHVKVGNALDALHGALDAIAYLIHLVEVGAKHLDGDAGSCTR